MALNYNLKPLQDNEIAGNKTINPIVTHLQGMNSLSDFLSIMPNGQGSVNFDFDAESLINVILGMVEDGETLSFDFKCALDDNKLQISSGKVYYPDTMVDVSGRTITLSNNDSGKMVYVRLSKPSSTITGELVLDDPVTHTLMTGNDSYRVCLPIAIVSKSNGKWKVRYRHLGSFAFQQLPHFWITGFDKSKTQSLDHVAGSNDLIWNSYELCD